MCQGHTKEFSDFRIRPGAAAISQTEVLAEAIVPLLSSLLTQPAQAGRYYSWVSINLTNTLLPTLVIP